MTDPVPLRRRDPDFCPRDGTPMADMERHGEPVRMCPVCGFWQGPDPLVMLGLWIERDGEVLLIQRGDTWTLPLYHMREAADPVTVLHDAFYSETESDAAISGIADVFTITDAALGEALLFLYHGTVVTLSSAGIAFHPSSNLSDFSSDPATLSAAQHIHATYSQP